MTKKWGWMQQDDKGDYLLVQEGQGRPDGQTAPIHLNPSDHQISLLTGAGHKVVVIDENGTFTYTKK